MLHVLNGDSTLKPLKRAAVPGEFTVWREMLMEGPVVTGPGGRVDWKARSIFLKARFGIDAQAYRTGMSDFFRRLEAAAEGGEDVVFWFEEDFFCQIHLVYLLAHLPAPLRRPGRSWIICPAKPLGQEGPAEMERLFHKRKALDAARLALARKVWKAYANRGHRSLERLTTSAAEAFKAWPLLQRGLRAHLARQAGQGTLGSLDKAVLRSLADGGAGGLRFPELFRRVVADRKVQPLGLGDLQVARRALDLAFAKPPLLSIRNGKARTGIARLDKPVGFMHWRLRPS